MVKLAYNPINFIPYFRISNDEITYDGKNLNIAQKIKDKNGEESVENIEVEVEKFTPQHSHKLFFLSFEFALLFLGILYILFAFFITKTNILSFLIWICGMGFALYLVKQEKFVFAEIVTAFFSLVCLITLYMFFKRLEIVYNHIGILFVGYFIISYVLYNINSKLKIMKANPIWGKISNYKFFIFYNNGK